MNLTTSFALHVVENGIKIDNSNVQDHLKEYKEKLVAETDCMRMCGADLSIGDYVKIQTPRGDRLEGKILSFYPYIPQVKLESGWCFHETDQILIHKHVVD